MPIKNTKLGKNVFIANEDLVNIYGCDIGDNVKTGIGSKIFKDILDNTVFKN